MSSFVISKSEYIKVAGICAGIRDAKDIFIFDYQAGKRMEKKDFHRVFSDFHTMNALSVQEQYGDEQPELDDEMYISEFEHGYRDGKAATTNPERLKKYICNLNMFFRSAHYQTEKPEYAFKMQMFFDRFICECLPLICNYKGDSWGEWRI